MPTPLRTIGQGSSPPNVPPESASAGGSSSGNRSRGRGESQMQVGGQGSSRSTVASRTSATSSSTVVRNPESTSLSSASDRGGPSLFQESRNFEIHGGQMVAAGGHHISVTINASSPPAGDKEDPRNSEVPLPLDNAKDLTPEPVSHARRSCEIYFSNMALKNRGSPLWIPEPNSNLCVPYRKRGVSIGDVGILLASGAFCSFFNICLPQDDPINQEGVPEGFYPIQPPLRFVNIQRHREFDPESCLASEPIEIHRHVYGEPSTTGLTFESTAAEGAILTMPHGAHSEDLINIRHFRRYIANHIESWYRHINGVRGCEAKNGDIRLVTGCDKTNAWGMATFYNSSVHDQREAARLKFQPTGDRSMGRAYRWEFSGSSDARTGPDLRDVEELRRAAASLDLGDARDETIMPAQSDDDSLLYENQCLFVRTLNTNLRVDVWDKLCEEIDSGALDVYGGSSGSDTGAGGSSRLFQQHGGGVSAQGNRSLGDTSTVPRGTLQTTDDTAAGPRLRFSWADTIMKYHPSNEFNDLILKMIFPDHATLPGARMVITEDKHWIDATTRTSTTIQIPGIPTPEAMIARFLFRETLVLENDFMYFEPPASTESLENTDKLGTGDLGQLDLPVGYGTASDRVDDFDLLGYKSASGSENWIDRQGPRRVGTTSWANPPLEVVPQPSKKSAIEKQSHHHPSSSYVRTDTEQGQGQGRVGDARLTSDAGRTR